MKSIPQEFLLDLEDGPFYYLPNYISSEESGLLFENLLKETAWRSDKIKMFGKTYDIPRLQAWYGDAKYIYSNIKLDPLTWTPILSHIKNSIMDCTGSTFNSVLINLYRDGQDSNGWHSDDEDTLGENPVIASLSLGGERNFQLKHKSKGYKHQITLKAGSLLIMGGTSQHYWLHQIPKTKKTVNPRINLTFRMIYS